MRNILITGGAGYIGSHTAKAVAAAGWNPITFDNLSMGHRWAVKWGPLVEADLADIAAIRSAIKGNDIDAVIHFAASSFVGESMKNPLKYFRNNTANTINLLEAMSEAGVPYIVFSSTCAVYGTPQSLPLVESHPRNPVNPYGESKLFIEKTMQWLGELKGLNWAALRYFNAAGADPDGEIGEDHDPETHLIPLVIDAVRGRRPPIRIFGTDYDTADGTAIRDYIHVTDLARAHVFTLQKLMKNGGSIACNLGTGSGHSVRDVIASVARVAGRDVPFEESARREGDPERLVADPTVAFDLLQWKPEIGDLDSIVETAWKWHQAQKK